MSHLDRTKKEKTTELIPCSYCGGKVQIICCYYEENIHNEDYVNNPHSGLRYKARHIPEDNTDCQLAKYLKKGETMAISFK